MKPHHLKKKEKKVQCESEEESNWICFDAESMKNYIDPNNLQNIDNIQFSEYSQPPKKEGGNQNGRSLERS